MHGTSMMKQWLDATRRAYTGVARATMRHHLVGVQAAFLIARLLPPHEFDGHGCRRMTVWRVDDLDPRSKPNFAAGRGCAYRADQTGLRLSFASIAPSSETLSHGWASSDTDRWRPPPVPSISGHFSRCSFRSDRFHARCLDLRLPVTPKMRFHLVQAFVGSGPGLPLALTTLSDDIDSRPPAPIVWHGRWQGHSANHVGAATDRPGGG